MSIVDLAVSNLTSPMILFFLLGLLAALGRSDLNVPEAIAKGMSLYLMLAIGFKGGVGVAQHGIDTTMVLALLAGTVLSAGIPLIAFQLLTLTTKLSRVDAAAVAAHYGSISIVTFLAASQALQSVALEPEGYMVAVAAAMETPAIFVALWLARSGGQGSFDSVTLREVALNGSIVMLTGAFIVGWITGEKGLADISAFIVAPFKGVLCLFLLDMGLIAGRGLREGWRNFTPPVVLFGLYMPLVGAALGLAAGALIGLSEGGVVLMATLSASASYIAVPGGDASGAARSQAFDLPAAVTGDHISVQSDDRHSALYVSRQRHSLRARHGDLSQETHRDHGRGPFDEPGDRDYR